MARFSVSTLSTMIVAHGKFKNVHDLNMHIYFAMYTFIQLSLKEIISFKYTGYHYKSQRLV